MAEFLTVNGTPAVPAGTLDENGNIVQEGVFSIEDINKRFADPGPKKPEEEALPEDDEPAITLDTTTFDPAAEIKIGEDTFKAEDVLNHLQTENKADYSKMSDADKAKLVNEYIASVNKEEPGETTTEGGEDPEITIGGETKKSSEWFAKMEAEDDADYSELPEKARQNLLDRYVTKLNASEWQKAGTQRDRVNSERKAQLDQQERTLATQKRSLTFEKKRMETRIAKARELAGKQMDETDLYDENGKLILKKNFEYNQILTAQNELPGLEEELKQISEKAAQADTDHLLAQITSLQTNHPELQTKDNFVDVVRKVEDEGQHDHPDYQTLRMIRKVLGEADAERVDAETAFKNLVADGVIKVGATRPALPNKPLKTPTASAAQRLAEAVRRKQANSTGPLPPGGLPNRPRPKSKITLGAQIRQSIATSGNKALEEAGY